MDVLSVAASLIACIQLAGALAKRLGPSSRSKDDMNRILATLCSFRGALEGLKTYMEFNAEDSIRMTAIQHLAQPLLACQEAIGIVDSRLKNINLVGKYIVGSLWDGKLDKSLKKLDEAKELLELSMQADQLTLTKAIEQYVRNLAQDVRDASQQINKNGKRLLGIDEAVRQAKRWQQDTDSSLTRLDHRIEVACKAEQSRHVDLKETILQAGLSQKEEETRREILRWLAHTDPNTNYNDARDKCVKDTGLWFLNGDMYRRWRHTPQSFLWLHGPPGCGKTVLSSTIIYDLSEFAKTQEGVGISACVVFYYFSFTTVQKRTWRNLVYSILLQIIQKTPRVPSAMVGLYEDYRHGEPPIGRVMAALQSVLLAAGQTYLVIDALDECPQEGGGRGDILTRLKDVLAWTLPNLHVIVTSRKESDIEARLAPLTHTSDSAWEAGLRPEDIDADIRISLQNRTNVGPFDKVWWGELKDEVQRTLIEGSNGSFRWVACQLQDLETCSRPSQIRRKLKLLPKTLDETYEQVLLNIDASSRAYAITILQWLVFSERTMRIGELADAVSLVNDPPTNPAQSQAHHIIQKLSSLVVVSKRTFTSDDHDFDSAGWKDQLEEVHLAHFSVKEYLSSQRILTGDVPYFQISADLSHAAIAKACLECLLLFEQPESLTKQSLKERPLLYYAATMWHKHARSVAEGNAREATAQLTLNLLGSKTSAPQNWLRISDPTSRWKESYNWLPKETSKVPAHSAIFLATHCGLLDVTTQLLQDHVRYNSREKIMSLLAAAGKGFTAIVSLFLDQEGISVYSRDGTSRTALHEAAQNGHDETVAFLLDKNARASARDKHGDTALHLAARLPDETIARMLLDSGSRVADANRRGETALHIAATSDSTAVVRLLLERNAPAAVVDSKGSTPLHNAAPGSEETVRLLVEANNIQIDALDGDGYSALALAFMHWNPEVVDYLLRNGAKKLFGEFDEADPNERLFEWAQGGTECYSYSGQHDVEVHSVDACLRVALDMGFGEQADLQRLLFLAAEGGWNRTAEFLVASPVVNVLQQDEKGNTALHKVFRSLRDETEHIDSDLRDCPVSLRLLSIARRIIEKAGAEIMMTPNRDGECAFKQAANWCWSEGTALMIELGARYCEVKPPYESTWLYQAARWHEWKVIKALAQRGEDMNQRDEQGRAPIHVVFGRNVMGFNPVETITALIECGADINARDNENQTVLHYWVQDSAWEERAKEVTMLLVKSGIDLDAQDEDGRTAIELWEERDMQGERCDKDILTALETAYGGLI